MEPFQMLVSDTFRLEDGTTAFAGRVETASKLIRACECEIVQNGKVLTNFRSQGEMILSGKKRNIAERAISTSDAIDLAALGLERGGFIIRSKP